MCFSNFVSSQTHFSFTNLDQKYSVSDSRKYCFRNCMATLSFFENETSAATSILEFFMLKHIFTKNFVKHCFYERVDFTSYFFGEIILRFSTVCITFMD